MSGSPQVTIDKPVADPYEVILNEGEGGTLTPLEPAEGQEPLPAELEGVTYSSVDDAEKKMELSYVIDGVEGGSETDFIQHISTEQATGSQNWSEGLIITDLNGNRYEVVKATHHNNGSDDGQGTPEWNRAGFSYTLKALPKEESVEGDHPKTEADKKEVEAEKQAEAVAATTTHNEAAPDPDAQYSPGSQTPVRLGSGETVTRSSSGTYEIRTDPNDPKATSTTSWDAKSNSVTVTHVVNGAETDAPTIIKYDEKTKTYVWADHQDAKGKKDNKDWTENEKAAAVLAFSDEICRQNGITDAAGQQMVRDRVAKMMTAGAGPQQAFDYLNTARTGYLAEAPKADPRNPNQPAPEKKDDLWYARGPAEAAYASLGHDSLPKPENRAGQNADPDWVAVNEKLGTLYNTEAQMWQRVLGDAQDAENNPQAFRTRFLGPNPNGMAEHLPTEFKQGQETIGPDGRPRSIPSPYDEQGASRASRVAQGVTERDFQAKEQAQREYDTKQAAYVTAKDAYDILTGPGGMYTVPQEQAAKAKLATATAERDAAETALQTAQATYDTNQSRIQDAVKDPKVMVALSNELGDPTRTYVYNATAKNAHNEWDVNRTTKLDVVANNMTVGGKAVQEDAAAVKGSIDGLDAGANLLFNMKGDREEAAQSRMKLTEVGAQTVAKTIEFSRQARMKRTELAQQAASEHAKLLQQEDQLRAQAREKNPILQGLLQMIATPYADAQAQRLGATGGRTKKQNKAGDLQADQQIANA